MVTTFATTIYIAISWKQYFDELLFSKISPNYNFLKIRSFWMLFIRISFLTINKYNYIT